MLPEVLAQLASSTKDRALEICTERGYTAKLDTINRVVLWSRLAGTADTPQLGGTQWLAVVDRWLSQFQGARLALCKGRTSCQLLCDPSAATCTV